MVSLGGPCAPRGGRGHDGAEIVSARACAAAARVSVGDRRVVGVGRIIFDTATSMNGWIADEAGSLDWLFAVDHDGLPEGGLLPKGVTVLVEGSTTYEWALRAEALLEHPEKWQLFYGQKPTFVFTRRSLPVPAGADVRFVSGPVAELLPRLRAAAGDGDIWVMGGGDLAGQFFDAGALDGIGLTVAPVALTGGAPLLPRRIEADRLRLVSAHAHGQFARLVYDVVR